MPRNIQYVIKQIKQLSIDYNICKGTVEKISKDINNIFLKYLKQQNINKFLNSNTGSKILDAIIFELFLSLGITATPIYTLPHLGQIGVPAGTVRGSLARWHSAQKNLKGYMRRTYNNRVSFPAY